MIEILKPGIYTTIQDLGRFSYRDFGVPNSGSMDMHAFRFANSILNNPMDHAVLETTMLGPEVRFTKPTQIAIAGADISPSINKKPVDNNKAIAINTGDILGFGKLRTGLRAYIAVKGGFKSPKVLNSRSLYVPLTQFGNLQKGHTVAYDSMNNFRLINSIGAVTDTRDFSDCTLNVLAGPEYEWLNNTQKAILFEQDFYISKYYNRMAYRLGETIDFNLPSMLTGPVLPGTVQLTPSGALIILMRDCQTTGGYPRILQLSESSINLLSQKKERDKLNFRLITKQT